MKKIIYILSLVVLFLSSCGEKKKDEVKSEPASDQKIALGEKLFAEKTCVACHAMETKVIGPSVKDIIKIYDENDGNIVEFLSGNSSPIVDTDPGQVAIMKANLDSFVKDLSQEELQAIAAYMRNSSK